MSEDNNRSKWLHLRLSPKEYQTVQRQFSKTTCRKISEYARKRLLSKPVTVNYRNQSLDELMRELIQLRSELNSIGNNFNQAVKKLHSLSMIRQFQDWITAYETDRQKLITQTGKIKELIISLSEKWLQS